MSPRKPQRRDGRIDTELRHVQDLSGLHDEAQTERPDPDARRGIAEHCTKTEPAKDRHAHDGRREQRNDMHEVQAVGLGFHASLRGLERRCSVGPADCVTSQGR